VIDSPLVSIVVTNYNYGRFLGAAVDSALAQTYSQVEVIVVDDGSSDESSAVMNTYGKRIVSIFRANGGMAAAINTGFDRSAGEIIVFLDSDDVLLPTAVERIVAKFDGSSVGKVHWPLREIDGEGAETGATVPSRPLPEGDLLEVMSRGGPMTGNGPPTSGNAFTRQLLEKIFPIPEARLKQHADAYLNTLAPLYGIVRTVDTPLGLYRVHGENDYASQPLLTRLHRNLEMFDYRCGLLAEHLALAEVDFNREQWKTLPDSYYPNLCRRARTLEIIGDIVSAGETFVLVDDGVYGAGPLIEGRSFVRLPVDSLDRDEEYVAAAIQHIEQARDDGASFIVFTKPVLWRIRHRVKLRAYLEANFRRTDTEGLVISFALRENAGLASNA
jgi:glycosyltransferase involved in cell wall biosynthesis